MVFADADRAQVSAQLIAAATQDEHITCAAVVGSAASGTQDAWSDIDLAFEVAPAQHLTAVADRWSQRMHTDHGAQAHLDLWDGPVLYRVFVLQSTLQVDLSFWPAGSLAPTSPAFAWLFHRTGSADSTDSTDSTDLDASTASTRSTTSTSAAEAADAADPAAAHSPPLPPALDLGWLYGLHARSSIARGRRLQALHMLNQMRDHIAVAACQRLGLPSAHARGVDDLPVALRQQLLDTVARDMTTAELRRCLQRLGDLVVRELAVGDTGKERALSAVLAELAVIPVPVYDPGPAKSATGVRAD